MRLIAFGAALLTIPCSLSLVTPLSLPAVKNPPPSSRLQNQLNWETTTFDIDESVRKQIVAEIHQIEKDHAVKVLYACESGSRAWGFPSADSDYDVRFIYVHPTEWYLSVDLERHRDVIELPIDDDLDINGWDLRKALQLFRKSNPALLEWLGSPISYREQYSTAQKMRDLAPIAYSPISCMYHYFSMAKSNFRVYLRGDRVRIKKYFYVLRPLLAVLWLEKELGVVPTEFQVLIEGTLPDGELKNAIYGLIEEKRSGAEMDDGPAIPVISQFIEDQMTRLKAEGFEKRMQKAPAQQLNQIFRETLEEVWCP